MKTIREQRIERALFRGGTLTVENPKYREALCLLTGFLLRDDLGPRELTAEALGLQGRCVSACILAREQGVAAGLVEIASVLQAHGVSVSFEKRDGEAIEPDDVLLRLAGRQEKLLELERVVLNVVQRMSGISTATRFYEERARRYGAATRIVGTRKTPWGLLDKRALHLGSGGTHRLGLGDAIIIKNNHLALLHAREREAVPLAIERAWRFRKDSAFLEIEVRSAEAAYVAAQVFFRLQEEAAEHYPCLVMLDNMTPEEVSAILGMLRRERIWDHVLVEASGGISETNLEDYLACGVDAISVGALTHSVRALDICQRIS
jgi:nicotinate-nucleotide pyrophosphorylase (carboxylating)